MAITLSENMAITLGVVITSLFLWLSILSIKISIAHKALHSVLEQEEILNEHTIALSKEFREILRDLYFMKRAVHEKHTYTTNTITELIKSIQILAQHTGHSTTHAKMSEEEKKYKSSLIIQQ